jgi:hypothetical protein
VVAAINRVEIHNAYWGIVADGSNIGLIHVSVTDSIVANGSYGFGAVDNNDQGGCVFLMLNRSTSANNGTGLYLSGSQGCVPAIVIAKSAVFSSTPQKAWDFANSRAYLESRGDNDFFGGSRNGTLTAHPQE